MFFCSSAEMSLRQNFGRHSLLSATLSPTPHLLGTGNSDYAVAHALTAHALVGCGNAIVLSLLP